jgi:DNA-directed RNA polymerase specialized sigma24 family protein
VPYRREPAVEEQIRAALRSDPAALVERAAVRDQASPVYLREECLVYLVREFALQGEAAHVATLSEALLGRCTRFIHGRLLVLGAQAAEDAYCEVVARLFDLILDVGSDRGDFLQVRFWVALEKMVISAFGRQVKEQARTRRHVPLTALPGEDGDEDEQHVAPGTLQAGEPRSAPDQALLVREALAALDEPYRTAVILRHYEGWPIEDRDPTVPTISRYFNKTPRTIRNWMATAEEALAAWRGERS